MIMKWLCTQCIKESTGAILFYFPFLLNLLGWQWLTKCSRFQVHTICTLYYVFTTPSQVSVHHHLVPLYRPLPYPPTPNHHTGSVSVSFFLFFSFLLSPFICPPMAVSLFSIYETVKWKLEQYDFESDAKAKWKWQW